MARSVLWPLAYAGQPSRLVAEEVALQEDGCCCLAHCDLAALEATYAASVPALRDFLASVERLAREEAAHQHWLRQSLFGRFS